MSSENLHEAPEALSTRTKDLHRALVSLREELEAIDWYQQRAEACTDDALREVLTHNRDEEVEHAMMTLEWLRRNDAVFDDKVREYLFRAGSIVAAESAAKAGAEGAQPGPAAGPRALGGSGAGDVSGEG